MTKDDITQFVKTGFSRDVSPDLVETHISWVILGDQFVFKIKKPIRYSFLDFSTLEKRLHFCRCEIRLNWRLTFNMYLEIVEIRKIQDQIFLGGVQGEIIDYAIRMRKQNPDRQMDILLREDKVTSSDIQRLAERVARFHQRTMVMKHADPSNLREKFNDISREASFLGEQLGAWANDVINAAIQISDLFLTKYEIQLLSRVKAGYFRDCHGDLHARNIFLDEEPVIFDCIEFNDDYRQIDVLNEVAFLCMDFDALGKQDLAAVFLDNYNSLFPAMGNESDKQIFLYYKAYRANVRAKVNSLRARATQEVFQKKALAESEKYLRLMQSYMQSF